MGVFRQTDVTAKCRKRNDRQVNHCERTEKRNFEKTREPTLKSTRCFLFFCHRTFLKQLPTHIAHIAKAPRANAETKALSKSAILPTHNGIFVFTFINKTNLLAKSKNHILQLICYF